ncbi:MAG: hypothetical protein HQL39_19765 [Alphaproteobacteria bacterium]|nr:hypothetical protein [Alphaproteobacteria bacterium]MBF0375634.1 hypothetical protein [Alphaproteobacteria bacterium]
MEDEKFCQPGRQDIRMIDCDADHHTALAEIERLREADSTSPEGQYRDTLLMLVAQYEAKGKPGP